MPSGLPIDEALPALKAALLTHPIVVLQAPPGAGKSTVVPLVLLGEPWVRGRRLLVLEPRRLAARAVARRMAQTLGEPVGRTVGYRMRLDTRVSRETRIEVVTEGVLTRMLQSDPALEGAAAVLFDEFHERSLQADLGLALALDAQAHVAQELRLLVMSATLDAVSVARFLGDAPVVSAPGRSFAVAVRYAGRAAPPLPSSSRGAAGEVSAERLTAQLTRRALEEQPGDALVFLPGAGEIRRVQRLLQTADLGAGVEVLPLFGDLSAAEQDAALGPSAAGVRKVVLATNIAETSLTIPGVRIVIDSGLVRRAEFDPVSGMSQLLTRRISRASAEQRAGRAGRVAPGVCYRAWSEEAHRSLAAYSPPEILEADLAPLALELALWGARDVQQLRFLDPPPGAMLASARDLLRRLEALDAALRVTPRGRAMADLGVHPRLAHMLLKGRELGLTPLAAALAAVLSERDVIAPRAAAAESSARPFHDADVRTRLELLSGAGDVERARAGTLPRVQRTWRSLIGQLDATAASRASRRDGLPDLGPAGLLLAFAYPDRIALRRPGSEGRYLLENGRGAFFADTQSLARQPLIVAAELDDREREARILLAAPLERAELERYFAAQLRREQTIEWSAREQAVSASETLRLGALTIDEQPLANVDPEATRAAMLQGVRVLGLQALPWSREIRELQARVAFVRALPDGAQSWPALDDGALENRLDEWLGPWLTGMTRREHLARVPLMEALRALLSFEQQRRLDELAPTHLTVPSGSRIRIDYLDENAPVLEVRLQEVFGLAASPRIAGGRVPLTFKLLSPARRPVQITRDLASFWRRGYAEVRKDLRGRYPRHYWPEDPLQAQPTSRVRPRG